MLWWICFQIQRFNFLNKMQKLVCTWFLKITFIPEAVVCVLTLRLLITSNVIWHDMDFIWLVFKQLQVHSFNIVAIVIRTIILCLCWECGHHFLNNFLVWRSCKKLYYSEARVKCYRQLKKKCFCRSHHEGDIVRWNISIHFPWRSWLTSSLWS